MKKDKYASIRGLLERTQPGQVLYFKAYGGTGFSVFRHGDKNPSEHIGDSTIHYRLATLHLQGLDACEVHEDQQGNCEAIVHEAPNPNRPLIAFKGALPGADVLDLSPIPLDGPLAPDADPPPLEEVRAAVLASLPGGDVLG